MTNSGTEAALARAGDLLPHPSGAVDQALDLAGGLVRDGVARLPALSLLGWALVGPVLVAPLEARPTVSARSK